MSELDKKLECVCPICGCDNQCAMADDRQVSDCWCLNVTIAEDALARVPKEARNKQCLCAACAQYQGGQSNEG